MQQIKVTDFPKPSSYGKAVKVGPASPLINWLILLFAFFLTGLATYQGAISPWKLNWWQWSLSGVGFIALSLVVHELLHLVAHPKFGISKESKFGAGLVFGVPALWVGYAGWVPKKRAIFICLLPFAVLAVIAPLVGLFLGTKAGSFLSFVGGANFVASRKDIVNSIHISKSISPEIFESESGYFEKDT
jgi:hypothetical protein